MKPMATIKEAASFTGLSYSKVYKMARSGEVKTFKSGKKFYINMKDLCEIIGIEFE